MVAKTVEGSFLPVLCLNNQETVLWFLFFGLAWLLAEAPVLLLCLGPWQTQPSETELPSPAEALWFFLLWKQEWVFGYALIICKEYTWYEGMSTGTAGSFSKTGSLTHIACYWPTPQCYPTSTCISLFGQEAKQNPVRIHTMVNPVDASQCVYVCVFRVGGRAGEGEERAITH